MKTLRQGKAPLPAGMVEGFLADRNYDLVLTAGNERTWQFRHHSNERPAVLRYRVEQGNIPAAEVPALLTAMESMMIPARVTRPAVRCQAFDQLFYSAMAQAITDRHLEMGEHMVDQLSPHDGIRVNRSYSPDGSCEVTVHDAHEARGLPSEYSGSGGLVFRTNQHGLFKSTALARLERLDKELALREETGIPATTKTRRERREETPPVEQLAPAERQLRFNAIVGILALRSDIGVVELDRDSQHVVKITDSLGKRGLPKDFGIIGDEILFGRNMDGVVSNRTLQRLVLLQASLEARQSGKGPIVERPR